MEKMMNPEMEVIRFENEDVIATSACDCVNGYCRNDCQKVGPGKDCNPDYTS